MMADLLNGVSDASEEVGNVISLEGKGLTFEKYLEMSCFGSGTAARNLEQILCQLIPAANSTHIKSRMKISI